MSPADQVKPYLLFPHWPAPSRVRAWVSTRTEGPSQGCYAAFNPSPDVGDDPATVALCRELLQQEVGQRPINWLKQVHGTDVLTHLAPGTEADAAVACNSDYACVVLTADCLPVFFCDQNASCVAVAHAGWRGLAAGVLENTLNAMPAPPDQLLVWLGPAIGSRVFEVGSEVRQAFLEQDPMAATAFIPSPYRLKYYMADLYRLARQRLERAGVTQIYGGNFCTVSDEERFYSYRRDGARTGRMASIIWLDDQE